MEEQDLERYRHELRVHCYRMLGSFDEAEDLVQETFLRAWRARDAFEGRSSVRTWLYRIATNACLDARRPRRILPFDLEPPSPSIPDRGPRPDLPWLQPFPDALLDPPAPAANEPDAVTIGRETIELAFLAAIQHLPPRQRAVLILRDVLDWPAAETADLLGLSVAAVNSALQRARPALRANLPARRSEWSGTASEEERKLVDRYIDAFERSDADAVAALMYTDVRITMPPFAFWLSGRADAHAVYLDSFDPTSPRHPGHQRMVPFAANRQPAVASYLRRPGEAEYRAFGIGVLRIEAGLIAELTVFGEPELFEAFGLPPVL
ncbi:RNA polymerase sigma-70 factor (ECF subfamily) [Kribbella amoyensis]|uniref:RNA polymerase sigma factor n=1 Tax=Kribbella amoyensis TaxID=996641 RepID=A0A561BKR0_9ACTN|nr:sigma-70 family RNA polymerase sigma factor [Kribbella amoyensis]TWD79467.1 RNA polymerase sigma-70 factor (ECF subfamily) [Kribbella amoyensis]